MSDILNKQIVLSLNRSWLPIGMRTVERAIVSLCSQSDGEHPCLALDFEIIKDDDGNDMLSYANPLTWEEWLTLEIRPQDLSINSARQQIRVPTVIVAANYNKVPRRKPRACSKSIYDRDAGICQYTGEYVGRANGNLDHINPRDRGGRDSFENLVWCRKDVNFNKANRTPQEANLKLIRLPKAPPEMPVIIRKSDARHESHLPFLSL